MKITSAIYTSCSLLIFSPKKTKDNADDDEKKVKKKGKSKVAGGSVGRGHQEPSSDSWDSELDIDRAMMMKAKPLQFQLTAPCTQQIGLTRSKAQTTP